MNACALALCWAAALLLNAVGNYFGLIDDKTAETLFIVLPALAVIAMRPSCHFGPREEPRGHA